jgi:hypothetical protein
MVTRKGARRIEPARKRTVVLPSQRVALTGAGEAIFFAGEAGYHAWRNAADQESDEAYGETVANGIN